MSQYTISLKVEPYLAEWIIHAFGTPVELPRESPESRLIKRFLDKPPKDYVEDPEDANLDIVIPWSKEKDPRVYQFLSPAAKLALRKSLETIFINNLWTELGDLNNLNCSLTDLIYAYLEKHGISEEHWETIRQKYYRMRKRYARNGISLKAK